MKKADTDHQACQLMPVSTQHTCTSTEVRFTTGAAVDIRKSVLCVMVSASGSSLDADLLFSMLPRVVITSYAIAS